MIVTFRDETVAFWKEQGFEAQEEFRADGYTCWSVDVPADHASLASPEYLEHVFAEQRAYPEMIRARFSPPLYAVIVQRRVATTPDREGKMMLPLARDIAVLREVFTRPDRGQTPQYLKLRTTKKVLGAMREVAQFGVKNIGYFLAPDKVETFPIDTVAGCLHGGIARRDEEVPSVPVAEDVHTSGSGERPA